MKLIKLNTDHYVIVTDSEIKEGDWYYWEITKTIQIAKLDSLNRLPKNSDGSKKITHSTQPLYKNDFWAIQELKLSEVKELIGEVDAEKKAEEVFPIISGAHPNINWDRANLQEGFVTGYTQALEDNKERKYTEGDIIEVVRLSLEDAETSVLWSKEWYPQKLADKILQSLQPKTQWEVDIINGKLTLKQ